MLAKKERKSKNGQNQLELSKEHCKLRLSIQSKKMVTVQ